MESHLTLRFAILIQVKLRSEKKGKTYSSFSNKLLLLLKDMHDLITPSMYLKLFYKRENAFLNKI